jgi:hypothetical protein
LQFGDFPYQFPVFFQLWSNLLLASVKSALASRSGVLGANILPESSIDRPPLRREHQPFYLSTLAGAALVIHSRLQRLQAVQ